MPLLLLICALLFTVPVQAQTFGAQTATLENGLRIVVIPNHRVPVITHMMWYKVGAADELPGLSGMAHYFEHLMFKGTRKMAPGEFSRIVKTLGGNDNAFTGQDFTAYFQSASKDHLSRLMEMEADRMVNLDPPADHFASEKNVVLEERRQRTENDPRNLFTEQMRSALFVNHPYGTPVIGWMNEIEAYTWEDVKRFYDRWYAPNNAYLVISGDVTLEEVLPLAQEHYGRLKPKTLPVRERPLVPPGYAQTRMTVTDTRVRQPVFQRLYLMPSFRMEAEDALALQVLGEALSSGSTTRLYQSLVVDQKKATSISLSYNGTALDYGSLWIAATPAQDVSIGELETLIDAELQDVLENGLSEAEVRDAVQRLQDEAVFARDSVAGPAMIFGYALTTGSSIEDVEYWPKDLQAVTLERVNDVARTYLDPAAPWIRPPVTGYLLPEDAQ